MPPKKSSKALAKLQKQIQRVDSSDEEEIPLCSAPTEPPAKRHRAVDAVAASWVGSRPLEETTRRPRARPKEKPPAPASAPPPSAPAAIDDGVDTLHVANLPTRATAGLLRQHCVETLGDDEANVTDCRVVEKARRFAFVECKDAPTARRLLDELDGTSWFGERLVVNAARPRTSRAEDRREAYEKLAEHVEKREQAKVEARAKKRQAERDAWEKAHGPRVRAEKAAARSQGHFGHGFGSDGRPLLHSGYKDML